MNMKLISVLLLSLLASCAATSNEGPRRNSAFNSTYVAQAIVAAGLPCSNPIEIAESAEKLLKDRGYASSLPTSEEIEFAKREHDLQKRQAAAVARKRLAHLEAQTRALEKEAEEAEAAAKK